MSIQWKVEALRPGQAFLVQYDNGVFFNTATGQQQLVQLFKNHPPISVGDWVDQPAFIQGDPSSGAASGISMSSSSAAVSGSSVASTMSQPTPKDNQPSAVGQAVSGLFANLFAPQNVAAYGNIAQAELARRRGIQLPQLTPSASIQPSSGSTWMLVVGGIGALGLVIWLVMRKKK